MATMKRGARNIKWIETYCRIPEGKFVGQAVKLRPWQKREIRKIYDNPAGTRTAILSFGRKNAKTTLSAFLLLLHLAGPEAKPNSQLFSAAQSRDQAAVLFALAAKIVRMSPELSAYVTIRDTAKQLFCEELGTLYRALSAEASTAFGLSPIFLVHDELGQVKGPRSELYEALETATAAQQNPLSIIISTQAPTDNDLLSVLIDDALKKHDERVLVSLYTADPDLDPFSDKAIKQANPAFGDFQNADEVRAMAESARRMPSREASYRNLVLNQRVEVNSPFVTPTVWKANGAAPVESLAGLRVYAGLDLSEINDLTAAVFIGELDGVLNVHCEFWLPEEGIRERSTRDRVPYDLWRDQGHLHVTPGRSVEYEWVAKRLFELSRELDIGAVGFDRWNFRHLKPWLLKAGFTEEESEALFVPFGQGFKDMSPALRALEGDLLNDRLAHGNHPVLTMCAANAVVQSDPAGNRKLAKDKSHGRIDGMVALAMARGVAATAEIQKKPEYRMMFVG